MRRRMMLIGMLIVVAGAVAAVPATAAAAASVSTKLTPTADGALVNARGNASYRVNWGVTFVQVTVRAKVPDGTMWAVYVFSRRNAVEPFWVDWVTITGGVGKLKVESPVDDPARVLILDENWVQVLEGVFPQ